MFLRHLIESKKPAVVVLPRNDPGGVAQAHCSGRHVLANDTSCAHRAAGTNRMRTDDSCVCANPDVIPDRRAAPAPQRHDVRRLANGAVAAQRTALQVNVAKMANVEASAYFGRQVEAYSQSISYVPAKRQVDGPADGRHRNEPPVAACTDEKPAEAIHEKSLRSVVSRHSSNDGAEARVATGVAANIGKEGGHHGFPSGTSSSSQELRREELSKLSATTLAGLPFTRAPARTLKVRKVPGSIVAPSPTVMGPASMQLGPIQTRLPIVGRPA